MSARCSETSSVEALWDGRLDANREGTLRSHLATCQVCASESRRLEALRAALRALPAPQASPLAIAAGRKLLLDAARAAVPAREAARGRALALGAAALALAAGVAFWIARTSAYGRDHGLAGSSATLASAPSELELRVTPGSDARWSQVSAGPREVVSLAAGSLDISVNRHGSARRLFVKLPDGELEDEGTVFTVTVAREHTQKVSVTQGSVALRLAGQPERHLAAGETFEAPHASLQAGSDSATPAADAGHATLRRPDSAPGSTASGHTVKPGTEADACPGAPRFEDCVDTFKRGEYAAAAEALDRYTATCSHHAEDATYLRMVSLARAGRTTEAATLARAYLARFPEGFRRKEAERLAAGG